MDRLLWYVNRIKTMSLPEIGYRAQQYFQKEKEKKGIVNLKHGDQDYDQILSASNKPVIPGIPAHLAKEFFGYSTFEFFGYSLDLTAKIDWHLDISSGKRFPDSFSKDIDIRSDKFGSAKVVWEINRLQFLLPIAIEYSVSKDRTHLQHLMKFVKSWVNDNPYLRGINWYSNIEVNIRLIVWYFCWELLWQNEELKNDTEFTEFASSVWLPAIYEHCMYSHANPSKYSSANNHLVAEYSGLFIAACCWNFSESSAWKVYAMKGLEKEIKLQYSSNGINKEEAAEYIQFITDFFLLPYAIASHYNTNFSQAYKDYIYKIADYISNLLDINKNYRKYGDEDDGKVLVVSTDPHFDNFSSILVSASIMFNDSRFKSIGGSFDIKNWLLWGNTGKEIFDKLETIPLSSSSKFYEQEGQFIFRKNNSPSNGQDIYMHFDAAPLGFLSIAAHGHADALSISLNVDGYPVIADIGTYTYHTEKKWRNYFISTIAHNTICIDNTNQAYQAGPTMWLDHYKTTVLKADKQKELEIVSAKHSGYNKLGCKHTRTIKFAPEKNTFTITDDIIVDAKEHDIAQPWHLHPGVNIQAINQHEFHFQNEKSVRKVYIKLDDQLKIDMVKGQEEPVLGWYSPSFLRKEPTSVIMGTVKTTGRQHISLNTIIQVLD